MDTEMMERELRVAQGEIAGLRKILDRKPYRCDKCGEGSRDNHLFAPPTNLFGGGNHHLCSKCLTEWDRLLMDHPTWLRQKTFEMQVALLVGTDGADSRAADLAKEKIAIDAEAFALSQQWMNGD